MCWGALCGAKYQCFGVGAAPGPALRGRVCGRRCPAPPSSDWAWGGSEGRCLPEKVLGRAGYFFFLPPARGKGVWFGFVLFAPLRSSPAPLRFLRPAAGSGDFLIFGVIFFFFLSTFFVIFLVVGSPFSPLGKRCSTSLLSARHPSPCAGGRGQLRGAHPGAELRSGASPPRAGCTRPAWLLSTPPTSACGQRRTAPPRGRRPAAASRWTRRR